MEADKGVVAIQDADVVKETVVVRGVGAEAEKTATKKTSRRRIAGNCDHKRMQAINLVTTADKHHKMENRNMQMWVGITTH